MIPLIFTSWDSEAFISHISPHVHQSEEYHRLLKKSFDRLSDKFGLLKDFEITKGRVRKQKHVPNVRIEEEYVMFKHFVRIIFENHLAEMQIYTILERDRWWILIIRIELFPESTREENP
jgi:hypothetical protein